MLHLTMIKSWQPKGLKLFYTTGSTAKIQAHHTDKIHDILQALALNIITCTIAIAENKLLLTKTNSIDII